MRSFDHYPWHDALLLTAPPPPVPASQSPQVQRFVKRGMYMCCSICDLAMEYCPGHMPTASGEAELAAADLERRVRECKGK